MAIGSRVSVVSVLAGCSGLQDRQQIADSRQQERTTAHDARFLLAAGCCLLSRMSTPYPNTSRRVKSVKATMIAPAAQAASSRRQNVIVMPSYGGGSPV